MKLAASISDMEKLMSFLKVGEEDPIALEALLNQIDFSESAMLMAIDHLKQHNSFAEYAKTCRYILEYELMVKRKSAMKL